MAPITMRILKHLPYCTVPSPYVRCTINSIISQPSNASTFMCQFIIIRENEKTSLCPTALSLLICHCPLLGLALRAVRGRIPFPKEPDAVPADVPCTSTVQRPFRTSTKGCDPLPSVLLRNLDRSYMSEYVSYAALP